MQGRSDGAQPPPRLPFPARRASAGPGGRPAPLASGVPVTDDFEAPEISAVIPTYRRPDLVAGAVRSALGQTFGRIEVIVVVDGGDGGDDGGGGGGETVAVLEAIGDPRIRIVRPARRLGNAGARNAGIDAARGAWIALLDDDDSWHPQKLERQLATARASPARFPIVSCRFEAVGASARYVWPARLPRPGQPISEYLFTRRGPSVAGAVQTSTFLVPRALFDAVRFDPAVSRYVDLDWLLRAARVDGVALVFADGPPLSVYSIEDSRDRISNQTDWRTDVDWIAARRDLVTPRAYGGYLLTQASIRAERSRDKRAFLPLLWRAVTQGRVSAGEVAFHVGNTFLPADVRRRLTSRRT